MVEGLSAPGIKAEMNDNRDVRTGHLDGRWQAPSLTLKFVSGEVMSWRFLSQGCGSQTLSYGEIANHNDSFIVIPLS